MQFQSQVWLADDATAAGDLYSRFHFFNLLITEGANYGYNVNSGKSWVILKNETDLIIKANDLFISRIVKSISAYRIMKS
jgi:hypothetical protein